MLQFWLVWKYLNSNRNFFTITSIFAVIGVALGVACLVVSMAVVSGFETTLRQAVIDVTGDISVGRRGTTIDKDEKVLSKVKKVLPSFVEQTPFLRAEAVVAHKKTISGVILEGLEAETIDKVLGLRRRLVDGQFELQNVVGGRYSAVIGKGLAKRFRLKVGEAFKVILPIPSKTNRRVFSPKVENFYVSGVVSLGKYDYDERFILTDIAVVQKLKSKPGEYTGVRVKTIDSEQALLDAPQLEANLGYPYIVRSWKDSSSNLLNAAQLEKLVIFFVTLIMVVTASFNVCSHLFISVLKKYSDISILKTMGAGTWFIAWLFSVQGMVFGALGAVFGIGLGVLLSHVFVWAQDWFDILPGEIYKLASIGVDFRVLDLVMILGASLLVCFLSTLAPAIRGARMNPVEGLRYE